VVPSDLQDITATTETVLAVIDAEGPDAVSFLGDLVGYGANSNAMVAHIRDRGITIMPDQACMRLRPGSSTSYALHDNLPRHWRMTSSRSHLVMRGIGDSSPIPRSSQE
jgi:hypothetical protein